ncbi:ATPase with role in protein import into the ER [Marasmius sp. AFHP31]|nr:ATPase with role in protein import into the ER [Marasmius sp. AFHP31]
MSSQASPPTTSQLVTSPSGISTFAPTSASTSTTTAPTSSPITSTPPTSSTAVVPGPIATIAVTAPSTRKTIVVVEAVFGGIGGTFILVVMLACCYKRWRARRTRCNEEDSAMVEGRAHSRSSDLVPTDQHRRNESQRTLQASITVIPKIEKLKYGSDGDVTSSYSWPQTSPSRSLSQRQRTDSGVVVASEPRKSVTRSTTFSTPTTAPAVLHTPEVLPDAKPTLEDPVEGNEASKNGRRDRTPENETERPSRGDRRRKNPIGPREIYEHPMSMVLSSSNLHFLYSEDGRSEENNPCLVPSTHLSEGGGLEAQTSRVSEVSPDADAEEGSSESNDGFVVAGDCEVEAEEREIVASSPAEAEETGYGAVISVDLGTSYTRVGVLKGGRIEIIPNEFGDLVTPSCVTFNGDERLVGKSAHDALLSNPETTLISAKRLIGRTVNDKGVGSKSSLLRVHNKNGKPVVNVQYRGGNKDFLPEEFTAMILSKMKDLAEAYLGEKVTHAVVTVPACFNDAQRQATKDAGTIAGLTILRLMNDPTATALAYGVHQNNVPGSKIIVYDLGGGTFDVSLLLVKEDGVFEVLATAGDSRLGGEDFDERVVRYMVEAFTSRTGRDVSNDSRAMNRLRMEVEKAKIILSGKPIATIEIEDFGDGDRFVETLTRDRFEELNSDLFVQTMDSVDQVLQDAGARKDEVDEIFLVGGSSKIPKVKQLLRDHFGKEPSKFRGSLVSPDAAVVYGGAVHGAVLGGHKLKKEVVLFDVATLSLGIDTYGGWFAPLIPRNTVIPTIKSEM